MTRITRCKHSRVEVTLLLLLLSHYVTCSSNLYMVDPLHKQTYPVDMEEVDSEQVDRVEDKILKLLGLPDTPRPSYKHLKENAAPQFMMHLYQEIQRYEGLDDVMPTPSPLLNEQLGPEFRNLSYQLEQSQKKIDDLDVVISFVNQVGKNRLNIEHEDDKRYYFELDDVPDASELKDAELRIYKTKSHHENEHYFITVFKIDSATGSSQFDVSVLDTLTVNSSFEGWLVFNVSEAMNVWMSDKGTNKGLFIQAHSITGAEVLPHRLGIVNRHGELDKQGFMVAFFKSLEPLSKKIPSIQRPAVKKRTKRASSGGDYWSSPDSHRLSRKLCQRKHLYVKFKRLRFDSWIIAPDGYPAFYCEGECSFPLSSHMNATNHAIVQTLVSLIQPKKFPKACCAPNKLSAITVLYFDETQNVVMKRYRNMVVQSCGCH